MATNPTTTTEGTTPMNLFPQTPEFLANRGKAESKGLASCALCGRGLKGSHSVIRSDDGATVTAPDAPGEGEWFGIGPECARKAGIRAFAR